MQVRGTATIVNARGKPERYQEGDAWWWQDVADIRFGHEEWELELDVTLEGRPAYRVIGQWDVPNRIWKVRKALSTPAKRLFAGIVLPVLVDSAEPAVVEIDWDEFRTSGAAEQLYADSGSVRRGIKAFVTELRSKPEMPVPESPRPTDATHPPIEGVGYDTWIAAVAGIVREKISRSDAPAYYEAHGFPAGRGEAISTAWYERLTGDDVLRDWYVHDAHA